jgi:hypothetical protein
VFELLLKCFNTLLEVRRVLGRRGLGSVPLLDFVLDTFLNVIVIACEGDASAKRAGECNCTHCLHVHVSILLCAAPGHVRGVIDCRE